MQNATPKRDMARVGAARPLSHSEFAVVERTMRRYDVVPTFLGAGPLLVLGLFWREPAAVAAVLRVLWQRRQMARALRRRGLPAWLASRQ